MTKPVKTIPTYGYHKDGSAQIFDLPEGEGLPKGWYDTPQDTPEPSDDDKVFMKGAAAKAEGKDRSIPPAYRGKPEAERWLAGFDADA